MMNNLHCQRDQIWNRLRDERLYTLTLRTPTLNVSSASSGGPDVQTTKENIFAILPACRVSSCWRVCIYVVCKFLYPITASTILHPPMRLKTSDALGVLQSFSARLGLPKHTTSWMKQLVPSLSRVKEPVLDFPHSILQANLISLLCYKSTLLGLCFQRTLDDPDSNNGKSIMEKKKKRVLNS